MQNTFMRAFERLLEDTKGRDDLWHFDTETHSSLFDGKRIDIRRNSAAEKDYEFRTAFSFSKDDDPAILEGVADDLLLAAIVGVINLRPWVLLNDETNPVNAENWLIISHNDPIEIYAIVIDGWHVSRPYWDLVKAASVPKDATADVISQTADAVLQNKKYFVVCDECSAHVPAGYMHCDAYCTGCAQSKYRIVY